MPESSPFDDTDTRTSESGIESQETAGDEAVEDVETEQPVDTTEEDAINAAAIGTVEDEDENSAENSEKEQPEQSQAQDDKQRTVVEPEAAHTTEATTKSADELRAARKITELGTKAAQLERTLESFVKRDAELIASDPTHFQRLLNNATTPEAQKYLDDVYKALPDVHKVEATRQFEEWKQVKLEGESEQQRIERVAKELVDKELAPIREREQQRLAAEQQSRDAEAVKTLTEFQTRHGITADDFKDLEPKMMQVFGGLRSAFPSLSDADLLDRSLLAINPDAVRQTAKREALIAESDRNAASMIQRSNPQSLPAAKPLSDEEQRLGQAFDQILKNQEKRMPRRP
jgi:hypothetical protein